MKFEQFKAGDWHPQYQYKSFSPSLVNHVWTWDDPPSTPCWKMPIGRSAS